MKRLGTLRDSNNDIMQGRGYSDFIYNIVLVANTEQTINIPTAASFVIPSCTGIVYVKIDGTVTVPSGNIVDGTAGEINPELLKIDGASTIHLIAPVACVCSLSWYADKVGGE